MYPNNLARVFLGTMVWLCATTSTAGTNDLMCTPEEGPYTDGSEAIFEDAHKTKGPYGFLRGWSVDIWSKNAQSSVLAMPTGKIGAFALEIQYSAVWGYLELKRDVYLNTKGKQALVFRVRGIRDASLYGQLWVTLRGALSRDWLNLVPVTDYMVTPTGEYNQNEWYTVAIPMKVLNPNGQPISGIIIQTGDLTQVYLDEIWLVQGLEFPLEGYTANTAPISSVFDHTMTDGNGNIAGLNKDGVVTAYTGEEGSLPNGKDATCRQSIPGVFYDGIMTNYKGASECGGVNFLSYDGHPSYDYAWSSILGTPIYAPADGEVILSDCTSHPGVVDWNEVKLYGSECMGRGTGYGKLLIDHVGPYMSSINHAAYVRPGLGVGSPVLKGEIVAYVGNTYTLDGVPELIAPHLHIGFLLDEGSDVYIPAAVNIKGENVPSKRVGTYVDPYGWRPEDRPDPYRVKAVSVPLWKQ